MTYIIYIYIYIYIPSHTGSPKDFHHFHQLPQRSSPPLNGFFPSQNAAIFGAFRFINGGSKPDGGWG